MTDEATPQPGNGPYSEHRAGLLAKAREAGTSPGVYLMKDYQGGILYVGKAKNLRNRLSTYFQAPAHEVTRTEMMVCRVATFDVILTETEAEALILECNLVKKHKPRFNVRLKDDKAFPYIKIQMGNDFPRLEWTRKVKKDGARYFGPFTSAWAARQTLQLLNETFKLRDCSENAFRHRSRPCILHQMGKCTAPCVQLIPPEAYRHSVKEAIRVLEGKSDRLVKELERGMEQAAEHEEYEKAAEYRDQIRNLELVTATQVVDEKDPDKSRDVVGLAREGTDAHGSILVFREGRMIAVRHYHLQNTDPSLSDGAILFDFLAQHYLSQRAEQEAAEREGAEAEVQSVKLPSVVVVATEFEDLELLERTAGVKIRLARGDVQRQMLQVAKSNAQHALEQAKEKAQGHGVEALEEIRDKLDLTRLPHRIECYDISNFQGGEAVASRVVFMDGAPDKNLYRRYKIRTVEGQNDFAMMREVLERRFSRVEEELPDLVVVDGGRGQLAQAVAILNELQVQAVEVVGLAKARTESDFTSSEVKASNERVFIPGRKNPVPLHPHMASYKLLVHVRDEAHRFAISYHRLLRDKRTMGE
jgi:excinuclease ABC subunit C